MQNPKSGEGAAIREVVERIHKLWRSRQYEDMGELLAEEVVIALPGASGSIRGREAYIESYRQYDQVATTHEFSPGEPVMDIVGDVAVALCPFFIDYEREGRRYQERGKETLVFSRSQGKWRVAWRMMETMPDEKGSD